MLRKILFALPLVVAFVLLTTFALPTVLADHLPTLPPESSVNVDQSGKVHRTTLAGGGPELDYGLVVLGESVTATIQLTVPTSDFSINSIGVLGADFLDFKIIEDNITGGPYSAGQLVTGKIRFTPSRAGLETATFSGTCSTPNSQCIFTPLALKGTGTYCGEDLIPSGKYWSDSYPTDAVIAHLEPGFRSKVKSFFKALRKAGAPPTVVSTFRSPEKAYLMHYSWRIIYRDLDPRDVPPIDNFTGVPHICWVHSKEDYTYDEKASKDAAKEMVVGFEIDKELKKPPALNGMHTRGKAIDMTIGWAGDIEIKNAAGETVLIDTKPRNGMNPQLWQVGASYGVHHFCCQPKDDKNHWSHNGH